MGNCLKLVSISGIPYEEEKSEEKKPLVVSTLQHDQVAFTGETSCKKRKKVRFKVQPEEPATETTTMGLPRMKKDTVRVKVVLTQCELKQILNRSTICHHPSRRPPTPPPSLSSVGHISGQMMVKCRRSRRSSVMCKCRCSWNPVLQTISEYGHY